MQSCESKPMVSPATPRILFLDDAPDRAVAFHDAHPSSSGPANAIQA